MVDDMVVIYHNCALQKNKKDKKKKKGHALMG